MFGHYPRYHRYREGHIRLVRGSYGRRSSLFRLLGLRQYAHFEGRTRHQRRDGRPRSKLQGDSYTAQDYNWLDSDEGWQFT